MGQWEFGFWVTLGGSETLGFGIWSCVTRESEIWDLGFGIWNEGCCEGWGDDLSYRHEVNAMLFVASHGHPAEHGVMNTGVYMPRAGLGKTRRRAGAAKFWPARRRNIGF